MSPRRIVFPLTLIGTSKTSVSCSKDPDTHRLNFSCPVLMVPEERTVFWAATAAKTWP